MFLIFVIFTMAIFGFGLAFLAWAWAPPVAGAWYPYIRLAVSILAFIIGLKIGVSVASLTTVLLFLLVE